jgi:hypothetical protein
LEAKFGQYQGVSLAILEKQDPSQQYRPILLAILESVIGIDKNVSCHQGFGE